MNTLIAFLLLATLSLSAVALESDQDQPIQIEADAAMIDEANGNSIHKGNVIIGIVLLALIVFLFGADAFNWMGDTGLKIVIGLAILVVIIISVRTIDRKKR